MTLGQRIKFLRESLYLTQQQLADELEVAKTTISMYEQGNRIPPLDNLIAMCRVFNVTLDFLCGITMVSVPSGESDLSDIIKQKLEKLENIEAKDLKSQLYEISSKLKSIADEL